MFWNNKTFYVSEVFVKLFAREKEENFIYTNEKELIPLLISYLFKVKWMINNDFTLDEDKKYFNDSLNEFLNNKHEKLYKQISEILRNDESNANFSMDFKIICFYNTNKKYRFFIQSEIPTVEDIIIIDSAFLLLLNALKFLSDNQKHILYLTIKEIEEKEIIKFGENIDETNQEAIVNEYKIINEKINNIIFENFDFDKKGNIIS